MRRGINIGNALDTRDGDERRFTVGLDHLDLIRAAGFDTIRLPVAWSHHAASHAPFEIAPSWLATVDEVLAGALDRQLEVIVDVHHDDEVCADPTAHRPRFLALWSQLAEHYAELPPTVRFELLNEPHLRLTGQRWNDLLAEALRVVRDSNPQREVIVGPSAMNTIGGLVDLVLPDDHRLIVTIHYYLPFEFTHQGADWWPGAIDWSGTTWGSSEDHEAVRDDLAAAAGWARRRGHRLLIGEFGTLDRAPADDRVAWTAHVRTVAEELGLAWCYWDFATDFGVFDPVGRRWDEPLRDALLPP